MKGKTWRMYRNAHSNQMRGHILVSLSRTCQLEQTPSSFLLSRTAWLTTCLPKALFPISRSRGQSPFLILHRSFPFPLHSLLSSTLNNSILKRGTDLSPLSSLYLLSVGLQMAGSEAMHLYTGNIATLSQPQPQPRHTRHSFSHLFHTGRSRSFLIFILIMKLRWERGLICVDRADNLLRQFPSIFYMHCFLVTDPEARVRFPALPEKK
jgi:hypothetical protein